MKAVSAGVLLGAMVVSANINSNGNYGLLRTISAKTLGRAKLNVGAGINYAQSSQFLEWLDTSITNHYADDEMAKLLSSNLYLSLGVASFWDFAVAMPFYWDGSVYSNSRHSGSDFGLGDLEVSTKLLYPPPGKKRLFYQAYVLGIAAGLTGMSDRGYYPRHMYYYSKNDNGDIFTTANGFVVKGLLAFTFDIGGVSTVPLEFNLNLGGAIPNGNRAITAIGNFALSYTPAEVITLFAEISSEIRGSTLLDSISKFRRDMIIASPGIRINSPAGVYITLAGDFAISDQSSRTYWPTDAVRDYSTAPVPQYGIQLMLGWNGFLSAQDDDHDGIVNDQDRCPKDAEDVDGFEDSDGCPDLDNDKDGIADVKDKCPNEPEDIDGFQDEDGCPDPDNDGDGITDLKDQCPKIAEDFDGFEDKDGCPDYDNDKDGVADSTDRCPNDPEDFDKFEDNDGCPDIDNDKDGIPDLKDKCPNEPETFNSVQDDDGCPDTIARPKEESKWPKQMTLSGVKFKTGIALMLPDSYVFLEPILQELTKYPELEIEVRGHTDSMGDYAKNMSISQLRAEAVRQYLVTKGIDSRRIRAVGFGSSSPIADNRTAAGREQNRRIEVVRIK
jgi:outer membrane protein OmpA-like peptidoglycan-associated protein